ncbi:hypothetical protein Lgra_1939 [Legionella gratiana]|uniref:Uncharacterized protein n=1 Tax=Legionella gratiana TaxID=45066 RepID=A0A378JGH1_9GAMM|nr:hypothetical protein [Legionella gratiana]KTD10973.1 hypothetical protein Lgra_1939 [Legionella gratiana]STX45947.1 Uncharacterised protein [Legionella gratiana]
MRPNCFLKSYKNGVTLSSENTHHRHAPNIQSIMRLPFNVYILDHGSRIKQANEPCLASAGLLSLNDAYNKTVQDLVSPQFSQTILQKDQTVLKHRKLQIFDETGVINNNLVNTIVPINQFVNKNMCF